MPEIEHFDAVVLGSGEGGKYLAWHLAREGQRVAVVERRLIGGSCPNTNCLPSKNEIWSAKVADLARHAAQFGTRTGAVDVDVAGVRARKRRMVDGLIDMHLEQFRVSGVALVMGEGRFTAPCTLEVRLNDGGVRVVAGTRVFLNLGTRAMVPPVPGLAEAAPLTHVEVLELDRVPAHLVVLGGGYVGLEMAQAWRRFGAAVTLIERGAQLAGREDRDVADELRRILSADGVEVLLETATLRVAGRSGEAVTVAVRGPAGERSLAGSDILVAAGRTPNTDGIGLDRAGIAVDARGFVAVDERLRSTTAEGVWALGECAGSPQFTHVSLDDFRVVRDTLAGRERTTTDRLVPYCLFTDPPFGRVGLGENEAARDGRAVRVGRLPMTSVLRTRTLDETNGFMKVLVAADSDRIEGFAMIGPEAGEVTAVVQMAMLAGLPFTAVRDAILTHPTMAEGLNGLLARVPPRAVVRAAA